MKHNSFFKRTLAAIIAAAVSMPMNVLPLAVMADGDGTAQQELVVRAEGREAAMPLPAPSPDRAVEEKEITWDFNKVPAAGVIDDTTGEAFVTEIPAPDSKTYPMVGSYHGLVFQCTGDSGAYVDLTQTNGASSIDRINLYSGSHVKLTVPADGKLTITGKAKKGSKLYCHTECSDADVSSIVNASSKDIEGDAVVDVQAGQTYYIFNTQSTAAYQFKTLKYAPVGEVTPPPQKPEMTPKPIAPPFVSKEVYSKEGVAITARYNGDGTLHQVSIGGIKEGDDMLQASDGNEKIFAWESFESMRPIRTRTADIPLASKPPVVDSSVKLSFTSYPLYVGNTLGYGADDWKTKGDYFTLTADVKDGMAVSWSVSDDSIIKLKSTDGNTAVVQALRTGTADVMAKLPDGDSASCAVSVIDNYSRRTVERIEFNANEINLKMGESAEVKPIIYPKDIYNNGMLDKTLTWESSNTAVASVTNGTITAVGSGTATIKVTSKDVQRTASFTVNVSGDTVSDAVTAAQTETVSMTVGDKTQLDVQCEGQVIWQSDNSYVADVDENGVVTAYSNSNRQVIGEYGATYWEEPDTVKIYATAKNGGKIAEFNVCVSDAPVAVQYVSMNKGNINLVKGTEKNVTAVVAPASLVGVDVNWSSSDESIARVTPTGRTIDDVNQAIITGVKAGTAVITAEVGGRKDTCMVTVTDSVVKTSGIKMEEAKTIDIDEVYTLKPEVTENATEQDIVWVGTNEDVATVGREGDVMGYSEGTAKAYAIAKDSLTDAQIRELQAWRKDGKRQVSNEEIAPYLTGTYAVCEITVEESSNYLRNVHVPAEAVTEYSINVLWSRASLYDVPEFGEYELYLNGELVSKSQTLGYTFCNLEPMTAYEIKVVAKGTEGEVLAQRTISATTKPAPIAVLNVLDFGAVGDGRVTDTYAIQKAIDMCPVGGEVWLPEGYTFYSGALFLKSDITFTVDGTLIGSTDPKDYPLTVGRWEGWRKVPQTASEWDNTESRDNADEKYLADNEYIHSSLINIGVHNENESGKASPANAKNIVIAGKGQINGNGFALAYAEGPNHKTINNQSVWKVKPPVTDPTTRGNSVVMFNAENVYMKDVVVGYSPSWTVHAVYSNHVTFDNMNVISQGKGDVGFGTGSEVGHLFNGDGIDPDSSTHINIFNSLFTAGDDAVTLKSGRNREGNELDKPCAYIRVTDCQAIDGLGGFGTGSENASGAHDILFQNLLVDGANLYGIWLKTNAARGGITENFQVRDTETNDVNSAVYLHNTYSSSSNNPAAENLIVRHITLDNISGNPRSYGIRADSTNKSWISDIRIKHPHFTTVKNCPMNYCVNVTVWDEENTAQWGAGATLYYTAVQEDTALAIRKGAYKIKEIDNENKVITAYIGTSYEEVIDGITSLLGGEQSYLLSDGVLTVTSPDGKHTADYMIDNTAEIPKSAYINALSIRDSNGTELLSGFDREVTEYHIKAAKTVTSLAIEPATEDIHASVKIKNNGADFNGTLTEGENRITIEVTASDYSETKTYTVTVDTAYLIAEDFSCVTDDTWGFAGNNVASIKTMSINNASGLTEGALKLLTSNKSESSISKTLDDEIVQLDRVQISFDWQSNVASGNGRNSYFALQDTDGNTIFGMHAHGKGKVQYFTERYDKSTDLEIFSNDWYAVDLVADFGASVINGTITNKRTGNLVKTLTDEPIATGAKNLGKLYAYDVWSAAPMSIDNVFVKEAQ